MIISQGVVKGGTINVDVKNNELVFDIKKGKKGNIIGEEFFSRNGKVESPRKA